VRWIAGLSVATMALHNLLDRIDPASLGKFAAIWMFLHTPGMYFIKPQVGVLIAYPLIPWFAVMAAGYATGTVLLRPDRKKLLIATGCVLTLAFFVLRGLNHYGNGVAGLPFGIPFSAGPWSVQPTLTGTVISFFNVLKYPPSLDYLLITLGPALLALAWFDSLGAERGFSRVLLVFGRVPMFYYILHIYLIHILAIVVAFVMHQPAAWLWQGAFVLARRPDGYGYHLPFIYLVWVVVIALLYLPCRWFMKFKQEHRDSNWLSYV
jgi:uncharacterized membrane protein